MKEYGKSKYSKRFVESVSIAVTALCAAAFALVGCGGVDLRFSVESVNLFVGETRDFAPYAVFAPSAARDKSFTLYSDGECVKISGTEVTATESGVATVYAEAFGKRVAVKVNCSYRDAAWLGISCDESLLVQSVADMKNVTFTAVTNDNIDPSLSFGWTVNGRDAGAGKTFEFVPERCGEYTVQARILNGAGEIYKISENVFVKAYLPSVAFGTVSGELVQARDFSPVRFTACESVDFKNPPSVYEWRVNGELFGTDRTFEFTPVVAGEYVISLKVNGLVREIDGKESVTVSASGLRAPKGSVAFDDGGGVFVTWRDGEYVKSVSVVSPDGRRQMYSAGEFTQAGLFGRGEFDATGIISVCAEGDAPGTYVLRLTGDVAGEEFEFTQYPHVAAEYLERRVYLKNAFLSDENDCMDFVTELYLTGVSSSDGYLAREIDPEAAVKAAKARAESMGLSVSATVRDSVLSVNFDEYANAPKTSDAVNTLQSYSVTPHLEYSQANRRGNDYVLQSDRRKETVAAENTEQLWYAVTHGCKPKIANGTVSAVYTRARTVLLNIIGKDYTDAQKVHAIYDWVQWTAVRSRSAERDSSVRFIDAVFIGADGAKAGVTAEGAAKTVALLCGMEGIECDVVYGESCKNLVTVGGEKYFVDVFAGKTAVSATRDLCTHAGLFIPLDEYTRPIAYCVQKHIYNGEYFDYYIDKSECADYESIKAAIFYAFGGQNYNSVTIRDAFGTVIMSSYEYGAEFACPQLDESELNTVAGNVVRAVKEFGLTVGAEYADGDVTLRTTDGGIVCVSANKPTAA